MRLQRDSLTSGFFALPFLFSSSSIAISKETTPMNTLQTMPGLPIILIVFAAAFATMGLAFLLPDLIGQKPKAKNHGSKTGQRPARRRQLRPPRQAQRIPRIRVRRSPRQHRRHRPASPERR
ncbi:hypothetical protein SAZ11_08475 [Streptomyces sp. FXJ1.4098]|nr:hypothetical protein [Streptomyces sp. FXJ1.4098]